MCYAFIKLFLSSSNIVYSYSHFQPLLLLIFLIISSYWWRWQDVVMIRTEEQLQTASVWCLLCLLELLLLCHRTLTVSVWRQNAAPAQLPPSPAERRSVLELAPRTFTPPPCSHGPGQTFTEVPSSILSICSLEVLAL